ncbi:MAG TPA: hypothetical protein VKQ89_02595 [Candidatus Angelobacter sp.]|nr:hypothetical protein [Candidatus Angelobacter sp.]
MKPTFALLAFVLFSFTAATAQKNEVGVTFGGTFTVSPKGTPICEIITCPPSGTIDIPPAFAFSASFAHRIANFKAAALFVELPVLASPSRSRTSVILSPTFSSFFFTPSLRVQFAPSASISPFVSGGAGFGHFSGGGSDTQWATQLGGGLDFKTRLPHLGFRIEVRDVINGRPSIGALSNVTDGHLQQIYTGGGVIVRF